MKLTSTHWARGRVPDTTTAGDFCRRLNDRQIFGLMQAINRARQTVWRQQHDSFYDLAIDRCRQVGFRKIVLRGDTNLSQSQPENQSRPAAPLTLRTQKNQKKRKFLIGLRLFEDQAANSVSSNDSQDAPAIIKAGRSVLFLEVSMSTARDEIFKSALSLPESERIHLASELLDSLPGTPPGLSVDEPGFEDELNRRFSDGSKSIPWDLGNQQLSDDLKQ